MIAAEDDPHLETFQSLAEQGLIALRALPAVGCEATAGYVFDHASHYVTKETEGRVWLELVEVKEHGGNSAVYHRPMPSCAQDRPLDASPAV